MKKDQHVVPNPDGGWDVVGEGIAKPQNILIRKEKQ